MRSKITSQALFSIMALLALTAGGSQAQQSPEAAEILTSSQAPAFEPLHVDGLGLRSESGNPVTLNGDAAWSILVRLTEQEAADYLAKRRQQGFNTILVNLLEHYFGGPRNQAGELPFIGPQNFSHPNPAYFDHVDRILRLAAEQQFYVLLAPAYLGFNCREQGWCQEMAHADNARLFDYGRYLGQRYRNFNNIIWVHGGDADAVEYGVADKVKAIADGIRSTETPQLHTAHCDRNKNSVECFSWLNLDFDTAYSNCTTIADVLTTMRAAQITQQKPFLFIEGIYENMKETPGCLYDQNIRAQLAGAVGHVFGNQPVWEFASGWQQQLDSAGAHDMEALWQTLAQLHRTERADWESLPLSSDKGYYIRFRRDHRLIAYLDDTDSFNAESELAEPSPPQEFCWLDLKKLPLTKQTCSRSTANRLIQAPYPSDWLLSTKP